jgi:hypothetical protein
MRRLNGQGIIYVETVKKAEGIAELLASDDTETLVYHAQLPKREREYRQDIFANGEQRVLVATSESFSLGVDIPCLRYVIHYDLPESPTQYWQGAGRAGRDGEQAVAILLYQDGEESSIKQRIEDTYPTIGDYQEVWKILRSCHDRGKTLLAMQDIERDIRDAAVEVIMKRLQAEGWIRYSGKAPLWRSIRILRMEELRDLGNTESARRSALDQLDCMVRYAQACGQSCHRRMILDHFRKREKTRHGVPFLFNRNWPKPIKDCCDLCDGLLPDMRLDKWLLQVPDTKPAYVGVNSDIAVASKKVQDSLF